MYDAALKLAGCRWGGGSWYDLGRARNLGRVRLAITVKHSADQPALLQQTFIRDLKQVHQRRGNTDTASL